MRNRLALFFAISAMILPLVFAIAGLIDGHTLIISAWMIIGSLVSAVPGVFSFLFARGTNRRPIKILSIIPIFMEIPFFFILGIVVSFI